MSDPNLLAGRYRMLERRDHTGASRRSRDELLHRDVTISEVRLPPPGPHRDRLLGRIRAAASLRHPGVAALHDVISGPDRVWLVTEAVEGRSLLQTVRADGPLTSERAAEVGLRVLDALAAAHARGVRLAATPDSVVLSSDGRVVLTGIAAPASADELRDLGATLFTAVEGRAPETGSLIAPRMADGTPLAAPVTGPTGSGPLIPLVESLLTADPARRPDATSARLTLERIAPGPAARQTGGPAGGRGARPGAGRARVVAAAAAAAAVLTGAVVFWLWPGPAEPEPEPTTAPVALPTAFSRAPAPCTLISAEQAAELSLKAAPVKEGARRCEWSTDDDSLPSNLRYTLWVDVFRFASDDKARREYASFMKQDRDRTRTAVGARLTVVKPPSPLPGIGSEAYTVQATNTLTYYTGVIFRAANLVVAVQYQRGVGEDGDGSTSKGALTATRRVLENLGRAK
ncbi:hypothetical protein GCM10010517_26120 [Streptosporangium fragile]|uniref:Protein kinase domain-containing protein n=1 Tax=Streptosporangium fragile TaxID=46186 RepID=A0ABP6IF52_9ACTN